MFELFSKHPKSANLTYFQHMKIAFSHSFKSLLASFVFAVHGVFPFMFENTGGNITIDISEAITQTNSFRKKLF